VLASEGDFAIVGKGTVTKVFQIDGKEVHLTFMNALHAPSLSANLVSVSQFDKAGYYLTFGGGSVVIREGGAGETILKGCGSAGMYVLQATEIYANISTAQPTSLKNWHRRLVHGSPGTIEEMRSNNLVSGLDITDHALDGRCLSCRAGRQHTHPYDGKSDANIPPLDLVTFSAMRPREAPPKACPKNSGIFASKTLRRRGSGASKTLNRTGVVTCKAKFA
jgi:hypothetical protein